MKKLFLLISLIILGFVAMAQTGSPLKMLNFHKLPNEIADLKSLKDECGRDSDLDNNKAALIRVKAQGFSEKTMLEFNPITRPGIEIINKKYYDGEMWLYVSSNCQGTIVIKYKGEYEFKLPSKLEAKGVYELVLGMETATLVINAVPQTAEIYVDGNKIGTGYGSAAISVGSEHRYKVTCADYIPEEDVVRTDKAEKIEKQIELRPNFGYITIKSEPSGAEVYIDGRKVGTTPYLSEMIEFGRRRVEIKKTGYEPYVKVVTIKIDEEENTQLDNVKLEKSKEPVVQQVPEKTTSQGQTKAKDKNTSQTASQTSGSTIPVKNGVFSVDDNKKVYFSKGNLQYQASTKTWRFAEHQWDIIGAANQNISKDYSGWIDLFGWGTGNNPTKNSPNNSDYASFSDWGNNTISNGSGNKWFTLTEEEWLYVFGLRSTNSGIRFAKATVNDVNGVILLPDNWNTSYYNLNKANEYDASFDSNHISQSDWHNKLEANGAVFLPAAGCRRGDLVKDVGSVGYYMSATSSNGSDDYAYCVCFYNGNKRNKLGTWYNRMNGYSVRLVCNVK